MTSDVCDWMRRMALLYRWILTGFEPANLAFGGGEWHDCHDSMSGQGQVSVAGGRVLTR